MMNTYAILGGDLRQRKLADLLHEDGKTVLLYGFDGEEEVSLEQAAGADVVILPMPVGRDAALYMPLSGRTLALEALWPMLREGQTVVGGNLDRATAALAAAAGVDIVDYFHREETQIANAVPTAEGAIAEAMAAMDRTIHGAQALVIGCGRIGKLTAQRLQALGARVTVSARRYSDFAWTQAMGWDTLHTEKLSGCLGAFDLICATVPTLILHRGLLAELKRSCVIVDVASAPGCTDFAAAGELGLKAVWARALPGRTAPVTAACAIRDAIYHILEERGEPI